MIGVGLVLQPDDEYLELLHETLERDADYFEIAPETTWRIDGRGDLHENGFFKRFHALAQRTGKPVVAHGVGLSMGSGNTQRQKKWLARVARDHARFGFRWYTDHLGVSAPRGLAITLPLALPMNDDSVRAVRGTLARMQRIVPDVGIENTAFHFYLGDPVREPAFIAKIVQRKRTHLLLDLHNVFTNSVNAGFDADEYVAKLPLDRVIEIHLSGGSTSDPAWLPSARSVRLDSHDADVPEEVWRLFDRVLPACKNVRGVTLERMEGTVAQDDVPRIHEEMRRIRVSIGGLS